jgi:hypothetical protein
VKLYRLRSTAPGEVKLSPNPVQASSLQRMQKSQRALVKIKIKSERNPNLRKERAVQGFHRPDGVDFLIVIVGNLLAPFIGDVDR